MVNCLNHSSPLMNQPKADRASLFAPVRGSVTVEAALAVPIFLFAFICLLYMMEMASIRTSVRAGLQEAGKKTAQEGYPTLTVTSKQVQNDVVNSIGKERLENSVVVDGADGIDCSASIFNVKNGVASLSVQYAIQIPVPMFAIARIPCEETMRVKAWTGYVKTVFGAEKREMVYVTETGLVYHKDRNCTHLDLSIRGVSSGEVADLRNQDGGKYYPCERCGKKSGATVYITDTGNRYHSSVSCSGLKRTIYLVPLSEVIGKGACQRCGQ